MKALVCHDVFYDLEAQIKDKNSIYSLLMNCSDNNKCSFWISTAALLKICNAIIKKGNVYQAKHIINIMDGSFATIPLRSSLFKNINCSKGIDGEYQIEIDSAIKMGLDAIISKNASRLRINNIKVPIMTPEEFLRLRSIETKTIDKVPFLDLKAQLHEIYNEIDDRITDIISNTKFVLGEYVDEFEINFSNTVDSKYSIAVSSGTDALHIALLSLDIGIGDTVIIPVNTFIATAEAISMVGANPLFVDCDNYYNIDVKQVREILEKKHMQIKCIIPVHLYGQPANMDEICDLASEFNLKIVEDCCQAHLAEWKGKKIGSYGEYGAFSFYPGKNLGAFGEGGAVITNSEELYLKAKMIRQHGEIERYQHHIIGHNYRMPAFQGAVLATKLRYLMKWTDMRRKNARIYDKLLREIEGIKTPKILNGASSVYHLYVIQTEDRDGLKSHLNNKGIGTGLHYPIPLHLQKAYRKMGHKEGDFPVAENAAKRILSLPMYPELTEQQIQYVCENIQAYFGK